ncbi:MAG: glycosyltransferase family 2 protein [Porphyromonadaceae bacterium]|nr:glycosyltransferase family 2 protein [Porphyromonadaceae bacterium]
MNTDARPTISIITVCYNAAETIERTLHSVAEQTYPAIEYIVVDGASKDHTLDLVRSYTPSARIYSEPDRGIYDAMNKGLAYATGDYVWFLNAGDALPHQAAVEQMVAEACDNVNAWPDVIYGDTLLIDAEDRIIGPRRLQPPKNLSWKSFRYGMLVCHQSFVAKRTLAPTYDLRYRFSADVDWCIRLMKQAKLYKRIDSPLSLYLNEGTTTANHRASLWERFDVMRRHYGLLPTLLRHIYFLFRSLNEGLAQKRLH